MTLYRALAQLGRFWNGELQMSASWLAAHHADYDKAGIEQVVVAQWPINKLVNDAAPFNAARLRRTRSGTHG